MEKMIAELTIKMPLDIRRQLVGVADADGISASAYVRDLIICDLQKRKRKYLALSSIFGAEGESDKALFGVTSSDEEADHE
jgi:hypothetical protein